MWLAYFLLQFCFFWELDKCARRTRAIHHHALLGFELEEVVNIPAALLFQNRGSLQRNMRRFWARFFDIVKEIAEDWKNPRLLTSRNSESLDTWDREKDISPPHTRTESHTGIYSNRENRADRSLRADLDHTSLSADKDTWGRTSKQLHARHTHTHTHTHTHEHVTHTRKEPVRILRQVFSTLSCEMIPSLSLAEFLFLSSHFPHPPAKPCPGAIFIKH